jgi:hypothetical protein
LLDDRNCVPFRAPPVRLLQVTAAAGSRDPGAAASGERASPCIEQSNGAARSSPCPFYSGCIINMSGYDFRKGQATPAASTGRTRDRTDHFEEKIKFCPIGERRIFKYRQEIISCG